VVMKNASLTVCPGVTVTPLPLLRRCAAGHAVAASYGAAGGCVNRRLE
jgi:hypothetical protein